MLPKNGVYIIQGELNHVVAALRRSIRWSGGHFHQDDDQDPLLNSFSQLKETLQRTSDVNELDSNLFLGPFLEVIRSEDTTGPITGVVLSSVNKFLSYGLLDPSSESASSGIDNLADAVTHARFVGTDTSSDEVVLMKILQVLRTLLLSPAGVHMTNEAVCEIMQSCFRICFEMRLSELLRRSAEQTLIDMVQLLFLRLPQFKEDLENILSAPHIRKMFKRSGPIAGGRKGKSRPKHRSMKTTTKPVEKEDGKTAVAAMKKTEIAKSEGHSHSDSEILDGKIQTMIEVPSSSVDDLTNHMKIMKLKPLSDGVEETDDGCETNLTSVDPDIMKSIEDISMLEQTKTHVEVSEETDGMAASKQEDANQDATNLENFEDHGVISIHYPEEDAQSIDSAYVEEEVTTENDTVKPQSPVETKESAKVEENTEYVNTQGVRFTPQEAHKEGHGPLTPYGLPCVRELLRFLITLINPHDRHNTNTMIHIGLSLLTVALESGASHIRHFPPLLQLVKNDMCKNLFFLLQCDIHLLFSLSMRVCFLLFEALKTDLKFQMERFFMRLIEILAIDNLTVPYEKREMALEYVNQLFHIPGLVQELYVNFDCDLHCTNTLEDVCKTLSKNAFRAGNLTSVNFLSLDGLLTIINQIEVDCGKETRNKSKEGRVVIPNERTLSTCSDMTNEEESCGEEQQEAVAGMALSTSGYATGQRFLGLNNGLKTGVPKALTDIVEEKSVLSREELNSKKIRKKLLSQGIEEFNKKPKKGIEFLQENGLLSKPFKAPELAVYLREHPRVDKKTLGEFIGARKNGDSLKAFVKSFSMENLRIDEALRNFLESFRLPGESPTISLILEEFSSVYFQNNPTPYKNIDAAFTLAYAVIMLNVDQHNKNVKQQKSMTLEEYKRNLRQTNNGEDFPPELLQEIYSNIRTNEIVMPSERVGKVKEAYEWKVLMQKCDGPDASYIPINSSLYDEEIFLIVWGPTVAALSYVYDNSNNKIHIQKSLMGFKKCATISAHYNLSEVFDNLLISLCKFTSLLTTGEPSENLPVSFGSNIKSQLSVRTVFALTHKQGDILREGWQNLLVCLLQLLKAKMLPQALTEVDDFVDPSGRISLMKEEQPIQKQDNTGVFAAFYSYMIANPDTSTRTSLTTEDRNAQEAAINCIKDCHPEHIITESKFLRPDSLQELVKALVIASKPEHSYESTDVPFDEDAAVFFLEFLVKVALQNRDRISLLWQSMREHLSNIIISAPKVSFLVERAVVGLLRLSIRLIRRDDISGQVLITLRILLMMHPKVLLSCSKQISYGLHELIRTNAENLRFSRDWITILTIMQVVGAGASPPIVKPGASLTLISGDLYSASGQEEKNDSGDLNDKNIEMTETEVTSEETMLNVSEQWLLINKNDDEGIPVNQFELRFKEKLNKHDSKVFIKASSSISFIVRDMTHVYDFNIFQCIYAVLLFGEASSNGGLKYKLENTVISEIEKELRQTPKKQKTKRQRASSPRGDNKKHESTNGDEDTDFSESTANIYDAISLQLLDLMHALHTNAASILGNVTWENFQDKQQAELKARWSSKESIDQLPSTFRGDVDNEMCLLWVKCWCPLLQGIARLCCDTRRDIRMSALTILQRSLLAEDLRKLSATEWENCFNQVLFPMLASLLELASDVDPLGLEETRMRAATLLCKGFLQHLNTLISLSTFTALWMTMLDFMDKYMHAENSDMLYEAIPESLKNMLLVMSTAGIFEHHHEVMANPSQPLQFKPDQKARQYSALWQVTWDRIDCFLPNLKGDLMATRQPVSLRASSPPEPDAPGAMTIHTTEDTLPKKESESKDTSTSIETTPSPQDPPQSTSPLSSPILVRASSPLLSDEPQGLNVQLFTPLPLLSPPGSAHAVTHPVPVLLPSMIEIPPEAEHTPTKSEDTKAEAPVNSPRAVFDI